MLREIDEAVLGRCEQKLSIGVTTGFRNDPMGSR